MDFNRNEVKQNRIIKNWSHFFR